MRLLKMFTLGLVSTCILASPAIAGWKLVPANKPAVVGDMTLTPSTDWNQASGRIGLQAYAWTHDGLGLNAVEFFGGVTSGQPLYKERRAKQNPMPKFDKAMLATDLADLFERSFRVQNDITDLTIDKIDSATLGHHKGVSVEYSYSLPDDELKRRGVARLAVVKDKLFVVNFHAPRLHYFDAGLAEAQAMMDSAGF